MINIDDIIDQRTRGKTLGQTYISGIADKISPDRTTRGGLGRYRNDLVAYARRELGVEMLTEDQEKLLRAVIDYPVVVVMSATGTGKTYTLAIIGIGLYKTREDVQVFSAAAPPEGNLKTLLWGEINRFVEDNPLTFQEDKVTTLHIERRAKQFLTGVTIPQGGSAKPEQIEAKFSGKHQKNLAFLFDEGDAIPDPVYVGADGCMSGGFARMVICFNPRKKHGEVWRMIKEERAHVISMSAFNHPNVISGDDVIPGAVSREKTVQRINDWCVYQGSIIDDDDQSKCFKLPDFLVGATAKLSTSKAGDPNSPEYPPLQPGYYRPVEQQFWYKVLGLFPPATESQLIRDEWIDAARSRWDLYVARHGETPPAGVEGRMGLDVADMGPDNNVAALMYGDWLAPLVKWNGVDPDKTADKATAIYQARGMKKANVDAIGVGAGVAPKMERSGCLGAVGVRVSETSKGRSPDGEFKLLRDDAYWGMRLWFESGRAMIPHDKRLEESLRAVTYELNGRNIIVQSKKSLISALDYSPDEMEALMLLFATDQSWMGGI